jgi:hypothetical protein
MEGNINIPLTGSMSVTDKIQCYLCGKDALESFPVGFYHDGVCFHKDYMSNSYIYCSGEYCNGNWIHCFVCDTTHANKTLYSQHVKTKKHRLNITDALAKLELGQLKTRRGSGSKTISGRSEEYVDEERMIPHETIEDERITKTIHEPTTEDTVMVKKKVTNDNGVPLLVLQKVFGADNNNALFFRHESQNPGSGGEYIVRKAFNVGEEKNITVNEQRFVFELTSLLLNMSMEDRSRLGYVLGCVVDINNEEDSIFKNIRVPRCTRDFETILLNGKDSVVQNLPCPRVHMTADGTHAYVSIIDIISHILATDTPIEALPSANSNGEPYLFQKYLDFKTEVYTPVTSTPAARILSMELHKVADGANVLYLFMKEWSDDFDPSHTKSNRAQVWMKTFTISPPTQKKGCPETHASQ